METLKAVIDQFAEVINGSDVDYDIISDDGCGYGYGYGFCYGDGSGSDYDFCSNDVCGHGYGYGNGFGSGLENGAGRGCGDDNGDEIAYFCGQKVYQIDDVSTLVDYIYGNVAKGRILRGDLTTKNCYIVKQGNLFAHGETLRAAMDALRNKLFEDMPEDERIVEFVKSHDWGKQYPSADYYEWHHRLTGSCEMGRSEFAKRHGYKLADDELLTVEEFIKLTESNYGGSVIKKLREAYCQH